MSDEPEEHCGYTEITERTKLAAAWTIAVMKSLAAQAGRRLGT